MTADGNNGTKQFLSWERGLWLTTVSLSQCCAKSATLKFSPLKCLHGGPDELFQKWWMANIIIVAGHLWVMNPLAFITLCFNHLVERTIFQKLWLVEVGYSFACCGVVAGQTLISNFVWFMVSAAIWSWSGLVLVIDTRQFSTVIISCATSLQL